MRESDHAREERDRFGVRALEQRRQLLVSDEFRSEEVGANEQDADAAARQRLGDVASPFAADLDVGIRPYVKAGKRL